MSDQTKPAYDSWEEFAKSMEKAGFRRTPLEWVPALDAAHSPIVGFPLPAEEAAELPKQGDVVLRTSSIPDDKRDIFIGLTETTDATPPSPAGGGDDPQRQSGIDTSKMFFSAVGDPRDFDYGDPDEDEDDDTDTPVIVESQR